MRFHRLRDWLNWQEGLHPRSIDLGLERVRRVARAMQWHLPTNTILVGGTNGKGSVVAYLEQVYRQAGWRVGAYTSPHLLRYNERVRVNGRQVDDSALVRAFDRLDRARHGVSLTYFEFGTLAAVDIFCRSRLDLMILEVGLGGRLDAVNIFSPQLSLISGVALDHQDWLGDDREAIGREKAGIFRSGVPAVCGEREPPEALLRRAREQQVPLQYPGSGFDLEEGAEGWNWCSAALSYEQLPRPAMAGSFQRYNAAAAVAAVTALQARLPVSEAAMREGLRRAVVPGRLQRLSGRPEWWLDVAHNVQAASMLARELDEQPCQGRTLVLVGMLRDKDRAQVVACLRGRVHGWHCAGIDGPRGGSGEELAGILAGHGEHGARAYPDVKAAYNALRAELEEPDRVVVFGSFYTVARVLALVGEGSSSPKPVA